MWLLPKSSQFTTRQIYVSIVLPLVVRYVYGYWCWYKKIDLSRTIPLITVMVGILKMVICSHILSSPNHTFEYIGLSLMTLFHFSHVLTVQKYLILWIRLFVSLKSDDHLKFWWNFVKTNFTQYCKMCLWLLLAVCVTVNYLNGYLRVEDSFDEFFNFSSCLQFLAIFIWLDCAVYYPLSMAIVYNSKVFGEKSLNFLVDRVKIEFDDLATSKKYLKFAALMLFSTFTTILLFPQLSSIHIPASLWSNYADPEITINQVDTIVLLFTIFTLLMYFEVGVRSCLSGVVLSNFSAFRTPLFAATTTTDCLLSSEPEKSMDAVSNTVCQLELLESKEPSECNTSESSILEVGILGKVTSDELNEEELKIVAQLKEGLIKPYNLETILKDYQKAVRFRRDFMCQSNIAPSAVATIPFTNYPFDIVHQQCCENVLGYITIPLGIAGPCVVNGKSFWIPLATTEGCLVASINRGFSVIRRSGGVAAFVLDDGMTRSPVLQSDSASDCLHLKNWLKRPANYKNIQYIFESTSRYAKLASINCTVVGKLIYIRFKASTGDAMGMNMVSKAVESSVEHLIQLFPQFSIVSLSGNHCSDKKAAAINWICGRGKSITCEINIKPQIISSILKVASVDKLVELNTKKNLIGSALSGATGGFNAHASNSVAAIFAATGQDLGQVVESSNCITVMEKNDDGSLYISCTMPSLEVGTVGGGTILPTQGACLEIMNVHKSGIGSPAESLAMLICSTVLAGELSLLASLCEGTLVKSHLIHNRSQTNIPNLCDTSSKKPVGFQIPHSGFSSKKYAEYTKDCQEKFKMISNLTPHKTCPML